MNHVRDQVFPLLADFARTDLQDLLRTNEWQFPNYNEDLVGAMAALYRLQDTYNISSVDMINNNMPGKQNKKLGSYKARVIVLPRHSSFLIVFPLSQLACAKNASYADYQLVKLPRKFTVFAPH